MDRKRASISLDVGGMIDKQDGRSRDLHVWRKHQVKIG
jgi:hypothetical protein